MPTEPMTLAEVHTILAYNRELIAETWNFFVTVHLALIGIIFVAHTAHVAWWTRLSLIIPYAGFMYINYQAQLDNYRYARKVIAYALQIESENPTGLAEIFRRGWIVEYIPHIYLAAFAFGLVFIVFSAQARHGFRGDRTA